MDLRFVVDGHFIQIRIVSLGLHHAIVPFVDIDLVFGFQIHQRMISSGLGHTDKPSAETGVYDDYLVFQGIIGNSNRVVFNSNWFLGNLNGVIFESQGVLRTGNRCFRSVATNN